MVTNVKCTNVPFHNSGRLMHVPYASTSDTVNQTAQQVLVNTKVGLTVDK